MARMIENLENAFEEMFDFITDLPSGLDGFESDFDAAFEELKELKATLTPPNEPLTPCDVCMYNPPSSMGGKPCCICPASPPVRDCEIMEYVETCEECGFCDGTSPERQEDT